MSGGRLTVVLWLVIGCAVAGMGFVRLGSALAAAPGDPVIAALNEDRPVADAALDRLVRSRQSALLWARGPALYRDLARGWTHVGRRAVADGRDGGDEAGGAFRRAGEAAEDGLRIAPLDPGSWLRLARIRLDLDGDPAAALVALRAAMIAAPYDPNRTETRVRLGLRLWPIFQAADRMRFQGQVGALWADEPEALVALAADPEAFLIILALLDDPASAAAFRSRLGGS